MRYFLLLLSTCAVMAQGCDRQPLDSRTVEELSEAQAQVAFAKSCKKILSSRNPVSDARAAFKAGDHRLLSWTTGGYSPELTAPSLEYSCYPWVENTAPRGLPKLPLGFSNGGCTTSDADIRLHACYESNWTYAEAFNREMLRVAPDARSISCGPPSRNLPKAEVTLEIIEPQSRHQVLDAPLAGANRKPEEWIGLDDYPVEARKSRLRGTTEIQIGLGSDGLVHDCTVTKSSGSPLLDDRTCELIQHRGQFLTRQSTPIGQPPRKPVDYVRMRQKWRPPA